MERVGSILKRVLPKYHLEEEAEAALILQRVAQFLQSRLGDRSTAVRPTRIAGDTLTLTVTSSVASQECSALLHSLRTLLHAEFPTLPFHHIRIVRGRTPHRVLPPS